MTPNFSLQLHGLGHHDLWPNFTQFKIYGNNDEEATFSQFKPVAVDLYFRDPFHYAQMLHIEAAIERKKLKEELQNCLRFAVQVDGSVDTKQQDKKFVFVRYNDRNFPPSIQTRLVSAKEVEKRDAEGPCDAVISSLKDFGLDDSHME